MLAFLLCPQDDKLAEEEEKFAPPHLSYWELFLIFLSFGMCSCLQP